MTTKIELNSLDKRLLLGLLRFGVVHVSGMVSAYKPYLDVKKTLLLTDQMLAYAAMLEEISDNNGYTSNPDITQEFADERIKALEAVVKECENISELATAQPETPLQ